MKPLPLPLAQAQAQAQAQAKAQTGTGALLSKRVHGSAELLAACTNNIPAGLPASSS